MALRSSLPTLRTSHNSSVISWTNRPFATHHLPANVRFFLFLRPAFSSALRDCSAPSPDHREDALLELLDALSCLLVRFGKHLLALGRLLLLQHHPIFFVGHGSLPGCGNHDITWEVVLFFREAV